MTLVHPSIHPGAFINRAIELPAALLLITKRYTPRLLFARTFGIRVESDRKNESEDRVSN